MRVFRIFWEALRDFWDELFLLALMNVVTALLAIPVVTFPPALAGLWNTANLVAQGKAIGWSDYFEGFRHYFWKAWGLALLNVLVTIIALTNIRFYTPGYAPFELSSALSLWMRAFWMAVAFVANLADVPAGAAVGAGGSTAAGGLAQRNRAIHHQPWLHLRAGGVAVDRGHHQHAAIGTMVLRHAGALCRRVQQGRAASAGATS